MIFKVAIIEDEKEAQENLESALRRYAQENHFEFAYFKFDNAFLFLNDFKPHAYDVVFMDIDMPGINGMDAAKEMRQNDESVSLLFVTNLAQYAIKGYEVDAYDFIVKPVNYEHLAIKLNRLLPQLEKRNNNKAISFSKGTNGQVIAVEPNDIKYIEVIGHDTIVHTIKEDILIHRSLNEIEKSLSQESFFRCNYCFIVNLKFISKIDKYECCMGTGERLQISHPRKKKFMDALLNYLGKRI